MELVSDPPLVRSYEEIEFFFTLTASNVDKFRYYFFYHTIAPTQKATRTQSNGIIDSSLSD